MSNNLVIPESYSRVKEEFENYQKFAEETIQNLNYKNVELEKRLDDLTNIVEVSKYINSFISDDNLIPMINDMIIGILGVTYSSIYLKEYGSLVVKATNSNSDFSEFSSDKIFSELRNGKPFIINSRDPLFDKELSKDGIHSLIGVPITLRDKFMGYIIVEHTLCDFFNYEHIKFISSIANQIGIALENNLLYNKIKEASIKDSLLGIYNRKYFFSYIEGLINKNPKKTFAIIMVDFDNFKMINDIFGHQFGDEVLTQSTKIISENLKSSDIMARYGGEEIVIYIDQCDDSDEVYKRINDIRIKISDNEIKYREVSKFVTASFGMSFYPKDGDNIQNVIRIADNRLYNSKKAGKNRVTNNS